VKIEIRNETCLCEDKKIKEVHVVGRSDTREQRPALISPMKQTAHTVSSQLLDCMSALDVA
jgi:hypothetical protein